MNPATCDCGRDLRWSSSRSFYNSSFCCLSLDLKEAVSRASKRRQWAISLSSVQLFKIQSEMGNIQIWIYFIFFMNDSMHWYLRKCNSGRPWPVSTLHTKPGPWRHGLLSLCGRTLPAYAEAWTQPSPASFWRTGMPTESRTLSANIGSGPHRCPCGLIGTNPSIQVAKSSGKTETRRVHQVNPNEIGTTWSTITPMHVMFRCPHLFVYVSFWQKWWWYQTSKISDLPSEDFPAADAVRAVWTCCRRSAAAWSLRYWDTEPLQQTLDKIFLAETLQCFAGLSVLTSLNHPGNRKINDLTWLIPILRRQSFILHLTCLSGKWLAIKYQFWILNFDQMDCESHSEVFLKSQQSWSQSFKPWLSPPFLCSLCVVDIQINKKVEQEFILRSEEISFCLADIYVEEKE